MRGHAAPDENTRTGLELYDQYYTLPNTSFLFMTSEKRRPVVAANRHDQCDGRAFCKQQKSLKYHNY